MTRKASTLVLLVSLVLAGISAVIVIPFIPLRISAPGAVLFLILFFTRNGINNHFLQLLLFYSWLWLVSCVVVSSSDILTATAMFCMALSIVLIIPMTIVGLKSRKSSCSVVDAGVVAASMILLLVVVGLVLTGQSESANVFYLLTLIAFISFFIYFAVHGICAEGRGVQIKKVITLVVGIVLLSCFITPVRWLVVRNKAILYENEEKYEQAFQTAEIEQRLASSLQLNRAYDSALHRRVRLSDNLNNDELRYHVLRQLVLHNSDETKAVQDLFHYCLNKTGREEECLEYFVQLPDSHISDSDATAMLLLSYDRKEWRIFAKAWPLTVTSTRKNISDEMDLCEVGKALYFAREESVALEILDNLVSRKCADWDAVRIVTMIHLLAGETQKARDALNTVSLPEHVAEAAYLHSMITGVEQNDVSFPLTEEGIIYDGVIRLVQCRIVTPKVKQGGKLKISFIWEAIKPVNPLWRVYVHIRQRVYGGGFFQGDHRFTDNGRKTDGWPMGKEMSYEIDIPVPKNIAPGEYSVDIGLWDGTRQCQSSAEPSENRIIEIIE